MDQGCNCCSDNGVLPDAEARAKAAGIAALQPQRIQTVVDNASLGLWNSILNERAHHGF